MSAPRWTTLTVLAAILYGGLYLLWYGGTPLGQTPVLDGQENLQLARQIALGQLPREPFYRATLYPLCLSAVASMGLDDQGLMAAVGLLGIGCHAFSALLVGRISARLWGDHRARIGGLLFAFYPVAVYFAADPLDTTFSLTWFLLGLDRLLMTRTVQRQESEAQLRSVKPFLLSGGAFALAFLARPNFLPVLPVLPAIAWVLQPRPGRSWWKAPAAVTTGMLLPILAYGAWQFRVCGEFRILPWQGAYALWVANSPDANGRYYAQKEVLNYTGQHENPARIESERLYRQETGANGPINIDALSRHWRARTLAHIASHPADWAGLQGRKLYYLVNDFEQYNNKTYAFQRQLSAFLRCNPLSWGWLLLLATAAVVVAFPTPWLELNARRGQGDLQKLSAPPSSHVPTTTPRPQRAAGLSVLCLGLAYLIGASLFLASDRFRFPLAPLLCAVAGGLGAVDTAQLKKLSPRTRILGSLLSVLVAALTFSNLWQVRDTSTFVQDQLLLANASLRAGDDREAIRWATEVIRTHPERRDAVFIRVQARFNQHLDANPPMGGREEWMKLLEEIGLDAGLPPSVEWISAVARWQLGQDQAAISIWRRLASNPEPSTALRSLALLVLSGQAEPAECARLREWDWRQPQPLLWMARLKLDGETFAAELDRFIPTDFVHRARKTAQALIGR